MHNLRSFKDKLKDLLYKQDNILAAWEGGSIATGFLDEFSDLDLYIVIEDDNTETVFTLLQEYFEQGFGIERSFRIPEPTWHGMSQCYYLLSDFPPYFYCDIAVVAVQNPHKFTEPDRHGNAVIWFDKQGNYSAEPTPDEERDKLLSRMYRNATATDWLSIIELQKALARDKWIASQLNYTMFLSRHLIPLLNIRYRPYKADFGIRNADRDYPPAAASDLEHLLRISSVEDIRNNTTRALAWYHELKSELAHVKKEQS